MLHYSCIAYLPYRTRYSPRRALCRKQTYLRICSRPVPAAEEITVTFLVTLRPRKRAGLVLKTPFLDKLQPFLKARECYPQKQNAVISTYPLHGELLYIVPAHAHIMLFSTLFLLALIRPDLERPRRIGIYDTVLLVSIIDVYHSHFFPHFNRLSIL